MRVHAVLRGALAPLILLGASALGSVSPARAELAPTPVEAGDIYFSAGIALYYYKTDDLKVARIYADDDFNGAGVITGDNPRGFLINFETNNSEVVTPEVNFGYAFKEPLFKGALGSRTRLHFSAYGNRREGQDFDPFSAPPSAAYSLVNPNTGVEELRDGWIAVQPLNGNEFLANGDDATFFHRFPLENNAMNYRVYFGSGDMMIYFDEPEGMFQFTRGGGLTVGYENAKYSFGLNSPQMQTAIPTLAPASWTYSFQLHTLYIGPRLGFSIGFEPARPVSMFLAGGFAPMLAFSSISGTEVGQCLSACDISIPAGSVGTAHLSDSDVNFAYDVRLEAGASLYLWVLRLTATIGGFANNQFTVPEEGEFGRFEAKLADQWGYYGRAMATFSF